MISRVVLSARVTKSLTKLPVQVRTKLQIWTDQVRHHGLDHARKTAGYHDEPIKAGPHAGERSIRLNKAWRAFYVIKSDGTAEFVSVEEINKHEYDR
jgi:proteic killer suppression protein